MSGIEKMKKIEPVDKPGEKFQKANSDFLRRQAMENHWKQNETKREQNETKQSEQQWLNNMFKKLEESE